MIRFDMIVHIHIYMIIYELYEELKSVKVLDVI